MSERLTQAHQDSLLQFIADVKAGIESRVAWAAHMTRILTPDAVLSAMDTETSPLPDCVAAAWDVEIDPP